MQLERKLKTALDESRLLILGAQVLFGFQFQSVFQEGFRHLSATAKSVQGAGLLLMLLTIGLLIAPSLYHQIVHGGESQLDALNVATWFAGARWRPARRPHTTRTMTAPTMAPISPAPSPA